MTDSPEPSAEFDPREFGKLYRSLSVEERKEFVGSLTPEQAYAVENLWEVRARDKQLAPSDTDWQYLIFMAGRGWGKLLDIHTPIATTSGWVEMGDIRPGDIVFDEQGCPTKVVWVSDEQVPPVSYRVHFSDNTFIDACSDHQWVTWTHADRKHYLRTYPNAENFPDDWVCWKEKRHFRQKNQVEYFGAKVRRTQEIFETQFFGKRGDRNHCIPQCRPLQLPDADLPIAPYTLGLWLADGTAKAGNITKHQDDHLFLRTRIELEGFQTTSYANDQQFGVIGLVKKLRENHLFGNKHIPSIYLRASYAQRLALLQGLLDGDGYVGKDNYCEFSNTNPKLAEGVYELLMSMGIRATRRMKIPKLNGENYTETEILKFVPTISVFSLPRKQSRLRFNRNQSLRRFHRMITQVELIESKPMRCIAVDSPNRMYLAGKEMIPTHNTDALMQWAHSQAMANPDSVGVICATTAGDVRDILLDGPSGILKKTPPYERPVHSSTKQLLTWPNGATARLRSADKPDGLRGLNSYWAACDEISSWRRPDSLNQILLGLRLGDHPRFVAATTPKPVKHLRALLQRKHLVVVTGSSYENRANLSDEWFENIIVPYIGTRQGQQEIDGILLDDQVGSLWTSQLIDDALWDESMPLPDMVRIVVAIDPAVSANPDSNETGIIVVGVDRARHCYVLDDLSLKSSPDGWATVAVQAYRDWNADRIVAEVNNGGDLVEHTIRTVDPDVPYTAVRASKGKVTRAEPVVALYEQHRIHHIGSFGVLQTQQIDWIPGNESPDRIDALVWAITELIFGEKNDPINIRQARARYVTKTSW